MVALDPIQINLPTGTTSGSGIALQLIDGAKEADGSKALDAAIEMFSGRRSSEIAGREARELKAKLAHELEKLYHER